MLTNSYIIAWKHATGDDAYGEPIFTAYTGLSLAIESEEYVRTVKLGKRDVRVSYRIIGQHLPDIREGDHVIVTIAGETIELQVIARDLTPGTTLGHVVFLLT